MPASGLCRDATVICTGLQGRESVSDKPCLTAESGRVYAAKIQPQASRGERGLTWRVPRAFSRPRWPALRRGAASSCSGSALGLQDSSDTRNAFLLRRVILEASWEGSGRACAFVVRESPFLQGAGVSLGCCRLAGCREREAVPVQDEEDGRTWPGTLSTLLLLAAGGGGGGCVPAALTGDTGSPSAQIVSRETGLSPKTCRTARFTLLRINRSA